MNNNRMKNVSELRAELSAVYAELRSGTVDAKVAKELANLAGKMITSAKIQIDYHTMRGDKTAKINFVHSVDE
jgi:predicted ABC-class ATPase